MSDPESTDKGIRSRRLGPAESSLDHWLPVQGDGRSDTLEVTPKVSWPDNRILSSSTLLPFLDSEVLRIYPFGVPGMTQGNWEARPLSGFRRTIEVISVNAADACGGQTVPISRLYLKEAWAPAQAATQYLATASSLSGSPGWDPGQAPPLLPGGRRLLMALPTSWFIKDLFCGVAIKINRRPESQGTKNQLRRNRDGRGVGGERGKRGLGLPKTQFPWQPASKIVWE